MAAHHKRHPRVSPKVHAACALLFEQHQKNAPDPITAIECLGCDILIVSSYTWRNRLARFVAAAFSKEHPAVTQLKNIVNRLNQMVEEMETDATPAKQRDFSQMLRPMLEALLRMIPPASAETPAESQTESPIQ